MTDASPDSRRKELCFIIGGARSGKSGFALSLADRTGGRAVFVATAEGLDDEMRELERTEVERMVDEAEKHGEEDRRAREEADTRNQAEQLMYTAERSLKDLGDKIAAEKREAAEAAVKGVREALESKDINRIRTAADRLQQTFADVSQAAYEAAASERQAAGASPAGGEASEEPGAEGGEEGVIDAEFTESD